MISTFYFFAAKMGGYLTSPDRDKEIEEKDIYISCTMRGWRRTNEDSHILYHETDKKYDGKSKL